MPTGTLQGIPAQPPRWPGWSTTRRWRGCSTSRTRPLRWRPGADPTVADLVGDRFGEQVVARSVDPLLAGVYAGSAATIGVRSAVPTLAAALDRGARNLTEAVREALPPPHTGSVFGAVDGGYAVLVDELVRRAASTGRRLRLSGSIVHRRAGNWSTTRVRATSPTPWCWRFPRRGCHV